MTVSITLTLEIDEDEAKEEWRDHNESLDRADRVKWGDLKSLLTDADKYQEYVESGEGNVTEADEFVDWCLGQL